MVMRGAPPNFDNPRTDAEWEAAKRFAREHLVFNSMLRRADTMSPGRVDGIIRHVIDMLMYYAVKDHGGGDWIARTLHAGDLPPTGTTAQEWFETTGTTSETFVTAAIGNGTAIADNTYIGIYGAQFHSSEARDGVAARAPYRPPATAVRFTIGGSRVAVWDLYTIWKTVAHIGPDSTPTEKLGSDIDFPVGVAESPIFVAQEKTVLIEYYEQVPNTATDFVLQLHGVVVERRGSGEGLNP